MEPQVMIAQLKAAKKFFDRSTECLTEDDSTFAPAEGMMTAAQQVAHVAQTVDWFMEGAFQRSDGFDMDFEKHIAEVMKIDSLAAARSWADRAFAAAEDVISARSAAELTQPLPEGPVMGGVPRFAVAGSIADHTAHHRGALTVYSRLCGHVAAMPYM